MPIGLAVYYSIGTCTQCGGSVVDHRRIVFDKASGTFREDRPLAFFDDANSVDDHPVEDFRVSRSGQTLAATVCHVGYCMGWDGGPTADADLRLWISRDGGTTWADWGQLLPASRILEVTDDDVLVRSWNLWRTRADWHGMTDEDWDAMLARLAPAGLAEVEGREERRYWVASGELHPAPKEPTPPAVGHITWYRPYDQPTDAVAWTGAGYGAYLLVFTDESGTIERVYAAEDWLEGAFVANDTLARSVGSYLHDMPGYRTTLELIDLTTLTIHDVEGLSLPLDFDHEAAGPQQEFYSFMTARPAPASLSARPVVHYVPLRLAEPRPQPPHVAIYYGAHSCEGVWDVYRTVPGDDGETVAIERPWAYFDERPGYITDFGLGPRAQTLAALECSRGLCGSGYEGPSEDALLALWVSRDAGATWEEWGEVPQYARIQTVTEDDVALWQWLGREANQTWWFRSGKEMAPPEGHEVGWFAGWFPDEEGGASPLWKLRGDGASYVTATGRTLLVPASGDDEVWSPLFLADGVLWSQVEREGADLFVVQDGAGAVRGAYTWTHPHRRLRLNAPLEDQRFLGELGPWLCWPDTTKVLVDLATQTVHPLPELPGRGLLLLLAAHSLTE